MFKYYGFTVFGPGRYIAFRSENRFEIEEPRDTKAQRKMNEGPISLCKGHGALSLTGSDKRVAEIKFL